MGKTIIVLIQEICEETGNDIEVHNIDWIYSDTILEKKVKICVTCPEKQKYKH